MKVQSISIKPFLLFCLIFCVINTTAQELNLFLIGDSTMSDKKNPEDNPEHGWGQVLPELLTKDITVHNHAVNGRSTKSFIDEGRWEIVLKKLTPGDFVFIQFGHNDQKTNSPDRYTNPYTGYRNNLEKFVKETREKGATPIIFSSIVRRDFNESGSLIDTHGPYPLVARMVANGLEAPFVDLQLATEKLELFYGEKRSKQLHLHFDSGQEAYYPEGKKDNTHLSRKGAVLVATLALQEVNSLKLLPLSNYIKEEVIQEDIFSNTVK